MNNPLIYGKNPTERIVSIEPGDGALVIFTQDEKNEIRVSSAPNYYWILGNKKFNHKCVQLRGNLHYGYGNLYQDRKKWAFDRFCGKKFDLFSIANAKEAIQIKDGYTYFKNLLFEDVTVAAFDLETTTLNHTPDAKILLIANTVRRNNQIIRKLFTHDEYPNEGAMISAWCNWMFAMNPSVIMAHNGYGFDWPYLKFCADRAGVKLYLGRNGGELYFDNYESKFRKDQTMDFHYHKPHVYGRELVDTLFLSIKYDNVEKKYENYKLKHIIEKEGLQVKDRVFYDADKIRDNHLIPEEWKKIKQYAIHDGDDCLALYDLMAPPFFYLAQSVPKPYQLIIESATGSQINAMMLRSYLQNAHSIPKASEAVDFEGAISFGIPGIYNNVVTFDVASLYPNVILQYNIYDNEKDPNSNFLKMLQVFTEKRLDYKKQGKTNKYYKDLSEAFKIFCNSSYGFLGSKGLNFNSPEKAAEVTRIGRDILRTAIKWATGKTIVDGEELCAPDAGETEPISD